MQHFVINFKFLPFPKPKLDVVVYIVHINYFKHVLSNLRVFKYIFLVSLRVCSSSTCTSVSELHEPNRSDQTY